jgi:DNA-binding XRE family transcriptional regulator
MYKAHILLMARSWKKFMQHITRKAEKAVPEQMSALRAVRDYYQRLGRELAAERKKLGVTQQALARATGIDQAEISRIESELVDPQLQTYVKLLAGMGLGLRVEPLPVVAKKRGVRRAPRKTAARIVRR